MPVLSCLPQELPTMTHDTNLGLSVYTLFYDEYQYIHQWIDCVGRFADEAVVVYTGEPRLYDKVAQIVREYRYINIDIVPFTQHCQKYSKEWKQSEIRNFALQATHHYWTLQLDIDEIIAGVAFKARVDQRLREHPELTALALPTLNLWTNGRVRVDGRWFPDWHYRVLSKEVRYTAGARHITIEGLPEVRKTKEAISHLPHMLGNIECSIIHHKYTEKPKLENNAFRCINKDVNEFDYYKGLKTASLEDMKKVMI